jgi:hypothetical protein
MWISSFQIRNFKSFRDSGQYALDRHVNVLVGQNNVGKTALLQALGQRLSSHPHKHAGLRRGEPVNPESTVSLDFVASSQAVRDAILGGGGHISLPIPKDWSTFDPGIILSRFIELRETRFSAAYRSSDNGTGWSHSTYPSTNLDSLEDRHIQFQVMPDRQSFTAPVMMGGRGDNIGIYMGSYLQSRIYIFDAIRTPRSYSPFGNVQLLSPGAENLAGVLNKLQASRSDYADYISLVSRVIPSVKWVSIEPSTTVSGSVEIRVWQTEEASRREDLSIPLADCGTGVGKCWLCCM